MTKKYDIKVSGTAPVLYPTESFFAFLETESGIPIELPKETPFSGEWGESLSVWIADVESTSIPIAIDTIWLSITERVFYSYQTSLPIASLKELMEQKDTSTGNFLYSRILIGMAPFGGIATWLDGEKKSVILGWGKAEKTEVEMIDFLPENPSVQIKDYCDFYINNDTRVKENLEKNGLPPRDLFDNYMKQFTYRYLPLFEHWDDDEEKWTKYTEEEQAKKPELDYIEEALYDGTHDKLHDGGLLNYHAAGKPKKLCMKWHVKKSEYTAYYWLDDQTIRAVFDKFYGTHPDTKTDFIIHVDTIKNKYQLALYRYGLKEPVIIPEEAYQLIVFKNKFEYFRSENYDQPKGAWIW